MPKADKTLSTKNLWKDNWDETRGHFLDWWDRKGFVLGSSVEKPIAKPHAKVAKPKEPATLEKKYTDAAYRAKANRYRLSRQSFKADIIPIADTMFGPGSLGTFLGSAPNFTPETVWYTPTIPAPDKCPPLVFNGEAKWWKIHEKVIAESVASSEGNYFVGCPDLIEGIDTLAELRDNEPLMIDMIDRPAWVKGKVAEINQVWFEAYQRIYDMTKFDDESSVFGAFRVWGPGKVAKLQCDESAMFSPDMFKEFVVPALTEQCRWLGNSIYHLDGTQCIAHLDHLLAIEELDAIEWTPQARIARGGEPYWYDLYRRILEGGKSLQVVMVKPEEVIPLFEAVGTKGVYVMVEFPDEKSVDELVEATKKYR